MRKPRITLETKLRVITDYNSPGMPIETIMKRNHVSLATLYRIIGEEVRKEGHGRQE